MKAYHATVHLVVRASSDAECWDQVSTLLSETGMSPGPNGEPSTLIDWGYTDGTIPARNYTNANPADELEIVEEDYDESDFYEMLRSKQAKARELSDEDREKMAEHILKENS